MAEEPRSTTRDDVLDMQIEFPFVKIVHDCLTKIFKSTKKYVEKEINNIVVESMKLKDETNFDVIVTKTKELEIKITNLRTEYERLTDQEEILLNNLEKRVVYLKHIEDHYKEKPIQTEYFEKRVWRLIIEYMLREGYFTSSKILIEDLGMQDFCDLDVFTESNKIVQSLKQKKCSAAIKWCTENKSKLSSSELEFELRLQEFIALVKKDKYIDAVNYARKNLAKFADDHLDKLKKVMGLLAFGREKSESIEKYKAVLEEDKWDWIITEFVKESYKLHSLAASSMLVKCLDIGVSILKTTFCTDDELFNENCPTCAKSFRTFSSKLPYVVKNHTSLICKITGEIMDEYNPPLMLPNHCIYSEKALKKMSTENNGYVTCPKTKSKYKFENCRRVYV